VPHLIKIEESLFKAQLQALLFESLKYKREVLEVFVQRATVYSYVVKVDIYEVL
jgi:hypothetical protein